MGTPWKCAARVGLSLAACVEHRLLWPDSNGRLVVHMSPEEVADEHERLHRLVHELSDARVRGNLNDAILFDGIVSKELPVDPVGQPSWLLSPTHIYVGDDQVPQEGLVVVSPTVSDGGVHLSIGHRYRVVTMNMDGRYFVWMATAVSLGP